MIAQLQQAGFAICVTLVVTAIFMMMLPSSGGNKLVKFAVSLFFLLSIVRPFAGANFTWEENLDQYLSPEDSAANMEELINRQLSASFEKRLVGEATEILKKQGIEAKNIHFTIHIAEDRSITITNLKIELDQKDQDRSSSAISEINRQFGLTAEVAFIE